jgi:periplasmic divalent cation tolerance protein
LQGFAIKVMTAGERGRYASSRFSSPVVRSPIAVVVARSKPLLVLTTCASPEEAARLAADLVERKLAACVNTIASVASTYRWRGEVEQAQESLLVIKTTEERFPALADAIRERSSYELPEVLAIPVQTGSADYLAWVAAAVEAR